MAILSTTTNYDLETINSAFILTAPAGSGLASPTVSGVWNYRNTTTGSSNTGPSVPPPAGSYYWYAETSGTSLGAVYTMELIDTLDASTYNYLLDFWYSNYGLSGGGTCLVQYWNGASWDTVQTIGWNTFYPGPWIAATQIDLSSYNNADGKLRWHFTTGGSTTFQNDFGLDDITFTVETASSSSSSLSSSSSSSLSSSSLSSSSSSSSLSSSSTSSSSSSLSSSSSSSSNSSSSSSSSTSTPHCTLDVHGLERVKWGPLAPSAAVIDTNYNKVISDENICELLRYVADGVFPYSIDNKLIFKQIRIVEEGTESEVQYEATWVLSAGNYYADIVHYMGVQYTYGATLWDEVTREIYYPIEIEYIDSKILRIWVSQSSVPHDSIIMIAGQGSTWSSSSSSSSSSLSSSSSSSSSSLSSSSSSSSLSSSSSSSSSSLSSSSSSSSLSSSSSSSSNSSSSSSSSTSVAGLRITEDVQIRITEDTQLRIVE